MPQLDQVSDIKKADVYFDGECVCHSVLFSDRSRKTIGIILPSRLVSNTAASEMMKIVGGVYKVKLSGESEWKSYKAGDSFDLAGEPFWNLSP